MSDDNIADVGGIGESTKEALELADIQSLRDLAYCSPDRVTKLPGITEEQVDGWKDEAQELLDDTDDDASSAVADSADGGNHDDTKDVAPDGFDGVRILIKANDDPLPDELSFIDTYGEIDRDSDLWETVKERAGELHDAIQDSPWTPSVLIYPKFSGWAPIVEFYIAAQNKSSSDRTISRHPIDHSSCWPPYDDDNPGRPTDEYGDSYYSEDGNIQTAGWKWFFENLQKKMIMNGGRRCIFVNADEYKSQFMYRVRKHKPSMDVHDFSEAVSEDEAEELFTNQDATIDAVEQAAGADEPDDLFDGFYQHLTDDEGNDEWDRGPLDDRNDWDDHHDGDGQPTRGQGRNTLN